MTIHFVNLDRSTEEEAEEEEEGNVMMQGDESGGAKGVFTSRKVGEKLL
jgi:hypothetical protein